MRIKEQVTVGKAVENAMLVHGLSLKITFLIDVNTEKIMSI